MTESVIQYHITFHVIFIESIESNDMDPKYSDKSLHLAEIGWSFSSYPSEGNMSLLTLEFIQK